MAESEREFETAERIICAIAEQYESSAEVRTLVAFDRQRGQFLLLHEGWRGYRRIHGILAHIEVHGGTFRVHEDGTEYGVANQLVDAGVPKDRIVLTMDAPSVRPAGEFAVA